jgi:chemotaxis protein methyltransferase CheR
VTLDGDEGLAALLEKLADERGFQGDAYKRGCLRRRIAVRMRAKGAASLEQYTALLDIDPGEYERLVDALTINVTKFYRNRETWDVLAHRVLPALWERRAGSIRCWSVGCASGEEPYTLAILLHELARESARRGMIRIDATDLDSGALARAESGEFESSAFDEMPDPLIARYFGREAPRRLDPEIQRLVKFRHHDLLTAAPPAPPYDLILCRNVLIYFDRRTQERVFERFVDALASDGYLVLGKVESLVGPARSQLVLEDLRERVYRRR